MFSFSVFYFRLIGCRLLRSDFKLVQNFENEFEWTLQAKEIQCSDLEIVPILIQRKLRSINFQLIQSPDKLQKQQIKTGASRIEMALETELLRTISFHLRKMKFPLVGCRCVAISIERIYQNQIISI